VAVAHTAAGRIAWAQASPLHFLAQTGKEHPLQEIGPHGFLLAAAAASACLLAKAVLRYLAIVLGKQRLLLQNPTHHKLPLSLSVPSPVSIIFPVQLLLFTPACSFSLESCKIISIKAHVLYFCT